MLSKECSESMGTMRSGGGGPISLSMTTEGSFASSGQDAAISALTGIGSGPEPLVMLLGSEPETTPPALSSGPEPPDALGSGLVPTVERSSGPEPNGIFDSVPEPTVELSSCAEPTRGLPSDSSPLFPERGRRVAELSLARNLELHAFLVIPRSYHACPTATCSCSTSRMAGITGM